MKQNKFIPVCIPTIGKKEKQNVLKCLNTNWISSKGEFVQEFETKFAKYCNRKYGISCTNGTTALHLALAGLKITKGDEVIMPAFSIISLAFAILYVGAKPVFVDSEPKTFNMDITKIEKKITNRTKAIIAMHTYGHPIDMRKIIKIAKKYNLKVIEDAAEAHGGEINNKKVGSFGDVSIFSFYSNKLLTTGEGGMVLTNNHIITNRINKLKNLYFKKNRFIHDELGFNYRMTNIQAAIGVAQLNKLDSFVNARRNNAKLYNEELKDTNYILPKECSYGKNVYWMYGILASTKKQKENVIKKLTKKNIETRTFFCPMNKQPMFKTKEKFPIAEMLYNKGFYLPSASNLTKKEIKYITKIIK